MSRIVAQASILWLVLSASGCMSSNHDQLAARDAGPFTQVDASDAAEADGTAGDDALADVEDALSDDAYDPPLPIQPDGPSVFTFVNGIPDAPAIRVCFALRTQSGFELQPVAPWPSDAAGIAYAHASADSSVPGGVDLASEDVRVVVISGDLASIGNRTCAELAAPPAGVVLSPLEVIPAGTLSHGRHVVMAAAGCVGGESHTDPAQETVCGVGYAPTHPTVTLLLGTVDRVPPSDRVGLQVFAASLATPLSQVDHVLADPVVRTTLATDLAPGAVAPQPPNADIEPDWFGGPGSPNRFEIFDSGQPGASSTVLVGDAMARGGVAGQDVVSGSNFTVVLVGPRAGLGDGAWWAGFTMTVIRSDPI